MLRKFMKILCFVMLSALLSCATLIKGVTDDLVAGVFQQNDLTLVKEAAPAYLMVLESMIYKNQNNRELLIAGIQLYSSYAGAFIEDDERRSVFNEKVFFWGRRLLQSYPLYNRYYLIPNDERDLKEEAFNKFISGIKKKDVPYVFWGMYAIGMDALTNTDNPAGLLYLPRLMKIAEKIYQLDSSYFNGAPHLFFGLYYGSYPEAFGGNPAKSKEEFEKAIEISKGIMLSHKVMFAEVYYKSQYDREGYERLLNEVINFNIDQYPDMRLMNIMAQKQAEKLMSEIDDYFF